MSEFNYKCTEEIFLRDIENHEMIIIKEDGIYRHIRFKDPKSFVYWFDIITWKGYLCVTGDIGCYVFSRIEDMFYFFNINQKDGSLFINPCYWSEKVQAESRFGNGIKRFSVDKFYENVRYYFDSQVEELEDYKQEELWCEVRKQINGDNEYECINQINDFCHDKINFWNFWELDNDEYTFNYIWICYAVVWGIKKYFEYKKGD